MKVLKLFGEAMFLLLLPIVLMAGIVFAYIYLPNFWMNFFIALAVASILIFVSRKIRSIFGKYSRTKSYRIGSLRIYSYKVWGFSGFIFFLFALIITLYQFWFSEIVFGYKLWHVLCAIGIIVVLLILSLIVVSLIRDRAVEIKAKKFQLAKEAREKEEMEKRKAEQERKGAEEERIRAERLGQIKKLIESINSKEQPLWSEILPVVQYFSLCPSKFSEIASKIPLAPLSQVVWISKIKKAIVWGGNFQEALQAIEKLVAKSYDDEELQLFIKQLDEFIKLISQCKDFKGYEEIMKCIESNCPTVFKLLPPK